MVRVDFNMDNIQKCLCPECPVQAKSECVKVKLNELSSKSSGSPGKDDVPGLYCSTGKATCEDLDPGEMCQCTKCEVFREYNLDKHKPGSYFCAIGASD
jgi:hypothetical protein